MSCCTYSPRVLREERWVCSECGSIAEEGDNISPLKLDDTDLDLFGWVESFKHPAVKCECGAEKTVNPTLHAFWCKKYNKKG